jgi:hypothetical protein
LKHSFTPSHGSAACGGAKRRVPTGGFANGIDLKAVIRGSAAGIPSTVPSFVLTILSIVFLQKKAVVECSQSECIETTVLIE